MQLSADYEGTQLEELTPENGNLLDTMRIDVSQMRFILFYFKII